MLFYSLFLPWCTDTDGKGFTATRATNGVLSLLSRQSESRLAPRAITEHVGIGILIAVVAAEQATDLIFKGAPFGVFCLPFVNLFGKRTRHGPDAKAKRDGIQYARDNHARQRFSPQPRHGQRENQNDDRNDGQHAVESVGAVASIHKFIQLFLEFPHIFSLFRAIFFTTDLL